jgi:hypothetical protein
LAISVTLWLPFLTRNALAALPHEKRPALSSLVRHKYFGATSLFPPGGEDLSEQFRAKVAEQVGRIIEAAEGMAMAADDARRTDFRETGISAVLDLWRWLTGVSDQVTPRLSRLTLELIRRERPTLLLTEPSGDRLEEAIGLILKAANRTWERSSAGAGTVSPNHARASLRRLETLLGLPISPESHVLLRMSLSRICPGDEVIEDYPLGPYYLEFYVPEYRLAFERQSEESPAEAGSGRRPLSADGDPSVESLVIRERQRKKGERCGAHGIILIEVPWDQTGNPASILKLISPRLHPDVFRRIIRVMGNPPPEI